MEDAIDIAVSVCLLVEDIETWDSRDLATKMSRAFSWATFAKDHPDMTAEEIASAAADGFAVEVQYEVV